MLVKQCFACRPKREFQESIPGGNASMDENQLLLRQRRCKNIGRRSLLTCANGKSDGNKFSWLALR
jgi:hypothetical protein